MAELGLCQASRLACQRHGRLASVGKELWTQGWWKTAGGPLRGGAVGQGCDGDG